MQKHFLYFNCTVHVLTLCYWCPSKKSKKLKNAAKLSFFDCLVFSLTLYHWCPAKKSKKLKNGAKLSCFDYTFPSLTLCYWCRLKNVVSRAFQHLLKIYHCAIILVNFASFSYFFNFLAGYK